MKTLESLPALRQFVKDGRKAGKTIAFVPTMGALHDGHLTLVREGLRRADICIPYIFLNPKQFAPTEDLASYPKTLESDLEKLRGVNASAVYLPHAGDIYPDGFATLVKPAGVALPLEGECRPVMFEGVATVLTKMFLHCLPDIALFGEKDYQQLLVIKQFTRDLDIPVDIIGIPTVREADGLALSSRNAYLTPAERAIAPKLYETLLAMKDRLAAGDDIPAIEEHARAALLSAGFARVDYITVRDAATLLPDTGHSGNLRILAAAHLGRARLIDNIAVTP